MDDTFYVNKITLDGTHKTPPCAIARFYSCTTILCILRSKDIAPIHGIAHGRMDRDNVHAPVTLPMGVKATGALGKKKAEEATRGHLTRRRPPCRPAPQAPTRTPIYQNRTAPTALRPYPLREATSPSSPSSSPLSLFLPSTPLLAPRRLVFPSVSARRRSTPPDLGFHAPF
jgi:hypothetical protein